MNVLWWFAAGIVVGAGSVGVGWYLNQLAHHMTDLRKDLGDNR
jgi:hypothetical protein